MTTTFNDPIINMTRLTSMTNMTFFFSNLPERKVGMKTLLLCLALIPALLFAQTRKQRKALEVQQKAEQQIISNLATHAEYFKGKSSEAIVEYVSGQFKSLGLEPKGDNGFGQPYKEENEKKFDTATYLKIDGTVLELNKEFFPLAWSSESSVRGMPVIALREKGVPWFFDLKNKLSGKVKFHANKIEDEIRKEAMRAALRGATALLVYNSSPMPDSIRFNKTDTSAAVTIPVIYVAAEGFKKYLHDNSKVLDIELNVSFKKFAPAGNNVLAFKNNSAPFTAVFAASLPFGKTSFENQLQLSTFMEAAKLLTASKATSCNYLFAVFDEDAATCFGTNHWLEHPTISPTLSYAVFIEPYIQSGYTKKILVQGISTAPAWKEVVAAAGLNAETITDSTSLPQNYSPFLFYRKSIPVLSLSNENGAKENIKPDYAFALQMIKFISRLAEAANTKDKLWIK